MKKALLVDGHSVIFRSYFAFARNPLRNSAGENTSALFGFANTLRKMLTELKPDYCAVVYDAPGTTFRHEKFEGYKLQRPPTPEELLKQIPVVKTMVEAWGLASFEVPGVEADDVLGSLALRLSREGLDVTVATTDKDMLQLVGGRVTVFDPWKSQRFRSADVRAKFGVGPERVADYLALVGDSSDNVPGVPGVGPKRALAILNRYETVEQALVEEPRLSGHDEILRLSRELVELDTAVEVDATLDGLAIRDQNKAVLRGLFERAEFASLAAEFTETEPLQIETVNLSGQAMSGRMGCCWEDGRGLWVSTDGSAVSLIPEGDRSTLSRLLGQSDVVKVGCGLKRQIRSLWHQGLEVEPPLWDVGIAAWLMDSNRRSYSCGDLVFRFLRQSPGDLDPATIAALSLRMMDELDPQLAAFGLVVPAEQQEMPFIPVLAGMEDRGVKVDVSLLGELKVEFGAKLHRIEQVIWERAGTEFNIASTKQLGEVLFERLGLPKGKKTKTGFSTSSAVLSALASEHSIVADVLSYRELAKLCNTYLEPLAAAADAETGRVHARFHQTGTSTGRLSASDPNLQNVPIRTDVGRRIRETFTAEEGRVLLSADYSQVELRVLAHMSGDEELKRAFDAGEDVHAWAAAAVMGVGVTDVTPEHRRVAKMVNYGLIYGMGDFGLATRLGVPIDKARVFLESYMQRFSGVARWRKELVETVKESGIARTLAGRIRPVADISSRNRNAAEAAKRAALNAPIQGSASDIMKRAMLGVTEALAAEGIKADMVLQIHDELLFEVDEPDASAAARVVTEVMESAWALDVPLVVDTGIGRNWAEAH